MLKKLFKKIFGTAKDTAEDLAEKTKEFTESEGFQNTMESVKGFGEKIADVAHGRGEDKIF